jgi:predicted porin
MQKKLIALAIASAFSAPVFADNANFTFYGVADVSYDVVTTGDGTTTANGATAVTGVTKQVVSSNVSKFGFKGAEDLGDGLAAIWQIEQQINIDDAAKNTFASRNTFAGLKGDFGTVLLGIHDTPYKLSTRKLDVFGDSIADNRALLGAVSGTSAAAAFDGRQSNALAYISPKMGGMTAAIARVNLKEANTNNTQLNGSALSLGVMYDAAPFYGGVGYEKHDLDYAAVGANESAAKVGFGFSQDMFSVGAVYEKTTDNLGAAQENKYGHNAYYLAGLFKMGQSAVKLAYGKAGVLGTGASQTADSDATMLAVGYDHGLSKNTKLYALYSKISNGKGINYAFTQSSAAGSSNSGFGTSPSVISLGMKHSF